MLVVDICHRIWARYHLAGYSKQDWLTPGEVARLLRMSSIAVPRTVGNIAPVLSLEADEWLRKSRVVRLLLNVSREDLLRLSL